VLQFYICLMVTFNRHIITLVHYNYEIPDQCLYSQALIHWTCWARRQRGGTRKSELWGFCISECKESQCKTQIPNTMQLEQQKRHFCIAPTIKVFEQITVTNTRCLVR